MPPKQKKEAADAVEEPAAKKAKTDEEEPKKEEEPKFVEPDAKPISGPAVKATVGFETAETTLNVVPTLGGKMLMGLSDGGMSYLLAGARANVGVKKGRYMFEVKVATLSPSGGGREKAKQMLRIGFSTQDAELLLGTSEESVCFDSDGAFFEGKLRKGNSMRFGKEVVAVVLNLDSSSPNCNTVNLYKDGKSFAEPKPLPEGLKGKTLYPHVTFRGISVLTNFGPTPTTALPFKCHMIQGAAEKDVVVTSKEPKDGKYEVVMPVAFPDEGTFDWLDTFMEKNPKFVELSDRKIVDWAKASGLWTKGGFRGGSNDKPNVTFGVKELDDFSVRRIVGAVAPIMPRNYVVMEVKSNLVADDRKEMLKKFNYPCYTKVAQVVMGEPTSAYKKRVQEKLLKDKQLRANNLWHAKKAELQRKRQAKQKQKELAKLRKEREAKLKEAKAKLEEEKKKKAAEEAAKKEGEEKKEEEKKEEKKEEPKEEAKEEAKEEKKEEPAPMEEDKEEEEEADPLDAETEPPTVELDDEEKKKNFLPVHIPDLTDKIMNGFYGKFTTPEKAEGFDDIRYEWQKESKAKEYLRNWVLEKKRTTRVEDLRPGGFFKEKKAAFEKVFAEWQDKLTKYKASKPKPAAAKKEEEAPKEAQLDIFTVTDISDVGEGKPLYDRFAFEDWMLVQLRFELALVMAAYKKELKDPDREIIPEEHFGFYYQRYFGKNLSMKNFGMTEFKDLIAPLKDTIQLKDGQLVPQLEDMESLDIFVKLTEEQRRERQRRIDAGDEMVRLKFICPANLTPKGEAKPAAPKAEAKPAAKETTAGTMAPKAGTTPAAAPAKGGAKGKK